MKNICEHFYANQWTREEPKRTRRKSPQRHSSWSTREGLLGRRRGVTGSAEIHNIILTWREDGLTAVNSETSKSYRKRRGVSFAVRVAQGAARKTKARTIKKNKQIRQGRKAAHQQAGHMFTNTV